jgi:hypothetical protein
MLAPFVLNLLITCSLLLLAGWTGDTISNWVGAARRTDTRESQPDAETGRRIDHATLTACTSCGTSGEWLWKIDHRELKGKVRA